MCVTKILFFPIISPSIRNSIVMEYIINKNYRRSRVTKNYHFSYFLIYEVMYEEIQDYLIN